MDSRRKRLARSVSRSRSRSRSRSATTPRNHDYSQRPSAARRALMMSLALEAREEPTVELSPKRSKALLVTRTPGGSLRVGGEVPVIRTPGGRIHVDQPLVVNSQMAENLETLDIDDEEADELVQNAPEKVRRWLGALPSEIEEAEVCALSKPLSPSTPAAGMGVGNVPSVASIQPNPSDAVDRPNDPPADDVRPSTSGMTTTAVRNVRQTVCEGSELDSDFDNDDEVVIGSIALANQGRLFGEVPDDEELEGPDHDIIAEVERAMDDEADRLLGVSTSYEWTSDFDSFRGVPEEFSGPTPGPIKDYDTPYDVFTDIWSNDIIELIVQETNKYAKQTIDSLKAAGTLKPTSRLREWVDTDADELLVFFAVFMYMGIDQRTSQHEYWRSNDVLEMAKFKQLLTYSRFILMNKFLHFVDNADVSQRSQHREGTMLSPKLAKIAPVISHLNEKFTSLYNLQREISIDESLMLFKGRLSWVQTIRSKAARFGIKSYELCESKSGYLYKFQIYTGKESGSVPSGAESLSADLAGKSTVVVLDLLKGLERKGHCVTMDNFYNCPALARYLKSLKFDCIGTLRANRRNVPEAISKLRKNVAKGTIVARHCGDVSIVAWKDSKVVNMISTYHDDETYIGSKAGKQLVKPVVVRDYNNTMGGVDLKDQKLSMYLLERKRCVKWYLKVFKRLLNVSIHNAFVMYGSSLKRRGKLPMTHREFRYALAQSLYERHRRPQPNIRQPVDDLMRLRREVLHVPVNTPGQNNRKRCVVCYKQGITKLVNISCETCNVFLHCGDCWRDYHSLRVLKGQERGRKRTRND